MALTTTGDVSRFRQQGTTDWVALAKAPVQFSFEVLARYSKAGIDPLTVAAGQAACTVLQIPWKVRQQTLERLSKLPRVALYGNVAWFGFGLKHVLMDLVDRNGGFECLTLCGCLVESFSPYNGATILEQFCRLQGMSSAILPGTRNWQTLLESCAGIFAASKFSILIHGFACLMISSSLYGMPVYEIAHAGAVAKALILLIQVSNKDLENITITDDIDCAWLAAFAEFVLGLRIEILTNDGVQEYISSNILANSDEKITITFLKGGAAKSEIEITRKCFIVENDRELFKKSIDEHDMPLLTHIRSPWTSILIDSFGKHAQDLLYDPVISGYFSKILVYASQVHPADYSMGENLTRGSIAMQYCSYSRYGDELLKFASWRLPELRPIVEKAATSGENHITPSMDHEARLHLKGACCCLNCQGIGIQRSDWCLLSIANCIITMISIFYVTNVQD